MPGSLALVTPAERILLWQKPHLRSVKAEAPGSAVTGHLGMEQ